jgi:hypothetical protein
MSMSFIEVFKPHQEAFNGELRFILLYLYKSLMNEFILLMIEENNFSSGWRMLNAIMPPS